MATGADNPANQNDNSSNEHIQIGGGAYLLYEFKHPTKVMCVAYAPNGGSVVTGCSDGACIWDVNTVQILKHLPGFTSEVRSGVAFFPDGGKIVTSSSDRGSPYGM